MRTFRYTVPPEDDGRLIKRVIRGRLGLSHRQFVLLKGEDGMLLDGTPVHANQIVRAGQVIQVRLAEKGGALEARPGPVDVVYEDQDLLIINKQAPLPCQASSRQQGDALEHYLAYRFRDQPSFTFRPVNRLDKGTSGLMAAAMNAHAQMVLSQALHGPGFLREYLALVEGVPPEPRGLVDAPIGKAPGATVRREVQPQGKSARTHYQVLATGQGLSLVRLRLETGRTHQIRVHMAYTGHPLLGDTVYGGRAVKGLAGQCLHARRLTFVHPRTGVPITVECPLPDWFTAVLNKLERGQTL